MQPRAPRYAIERPLAFRMRSKAGPLAGTGRTVNISRRGMLFETDAELVVGKRIEIDVDMGDSVGGGAPINLHVQGVTLRRDNSSIAVVIRRHKLSADEQAAEQP